MTTEQKIIELAKMDGWSQTIHNIPQWEVTGYMGEGKYVIKSVIGFENDGTFKLLKNLPNYLTSYDAIIPLIQKLRMSIWSELFAELSLIQEPCECGLHWASWAFEFSPSQLADALLKAKGFEV